MDQKLYENSLNILKNELIVALGCTEPIAIAYVAAKARAVLGEMPVSCTVRCSGNIIKNVMGVTVPNSGGQRGIDAAAILGILGGDAGRELAVLQTVTEEHIAKSRELVASGFCKCTLAEGVENLYIDVVVTAADGQTAEVEACKYHNNITLIKKNADVLQSASGCGAEASDAPVVDKSLLTVRNILEFADAVRIEDVKEVLDRQISYNCAISQEGLAGNYGVQAGRVLLERVANHAPGTMLRASAAAAAGSDARMSGCALPVVINSGSGNQGITVCLPVVEYARSYDVPQERLYRGLVAANLLSVHQKKYIGSLSAYCGAVSAATAAAAGIAYMMGEPYQVICDTITNTIATIGGMVCDGAKSSCATKIFMAVQCALSSMELARVGNAFQPGEGIVKDDVENTIASVGRMGRVGMHGTDVEILNIMLDN